MWIIKAHYVVIVECNKEIDNILIHGNYFFDI